MWCQGTEILVGSLLTEFSIGKESLKQHHLDSSSSLQGFKCSQFAEFAPENCSRCLAATGTFFAFQWIRSESRSLQMKKKSSNFHNMFAADRHSSKNGSESVRIWRPWLRWSHWPRSTCAVRCRHHRKRLECQPLTFPVPSFCRDSYHRWCQILQFFNNWFAFTNRRKINGSTEYVYSSIFMYIPCWYHVLMFSSYPFAPICCFSMFLVAFHAIPGASRHLAGWRSSQKTSALTQFSWNLLFQEQRRLCEKIVTCLQLRFKMV